MADAIVPSVELKVQQAVEGLQAARQKLVTAELNLDRRRDLFAKGLNSSRDMELAELAFTNAQTGVEIANREVKVAQYAQTKAEAEINAKIQDSHAKLAIDYPEELEEFLVEKQARQNPTGRLLWGLAALFVAVLIVAQAAWFNRDDLLYRYPELMPWMKQLCEKLDCELIRSRDVAAIKLLNRDVRSHPRFVDTLLVNATMTNLSQGVQLFPRVQLTLFDTSGNIVAFREFKPAEYLDNSIGIDEGMPPNYPVHFVLEVTGPTEGAVSFEFRFL